MTDAYSSYQVTDEDFVSACKNASYWARRRCLKKMTKVRWRAAQWVPEDKKNAIPAGVRRQPLPPKDVEEYVKNFVWRNKDENLQGQTEAGNEHAQQPPNG